MLLCLPYVRLIGGFYYVLLDAFDLFFFRGDLQVVLYFGKRQEFVPSNACPTLCALHIAWFF